MFVNAEVLFHYEHGSNLRIADETFDKLLGEVSGEDFSPYKVVDRLCCEQLMRFVEHEKIDMNETSSRKMLARYLEPFVPDSEKFVDRLFSFVHVEAKLPAFEKDYIPGRPIEISVEQNREQIIEYLAGIRKSSTTADLAFYACRDMESCDWQPFIIAAIERNPVSIEAAKEKTIQQAYDWLSDMRNESIYEGKRLAQPDEVANYATGDGVEKAITLANVVRERYPDESIEIVIENQEVLVRADTEYRFRSKKGFDKNLTIQAAKP